MAKLLSIPHFKSSSRGFLPSYVTQRILSSSSIRLSLLNQDMLQENCKNIINYCYHLTWYNLVYRHQFCMVVAYLNHHSCTIGWCQCLTVLMTDHGSWFCQRHRGSQCSWWCQQRLPQICCCAGSEDRFRLSGQVSQEPVHTTRQRHTRSHYNLEVYLSAMHDLIWFCLTTLHN